MNKLYRNVLDLNWTPDPIERRHNISKEIVRHADYLPKTLTYEDIDRSIKTWVEDSISIVQDGVKLPTMVLYSNQRFSEYMQTWKYTDENNNVRLNFKTITRENNPSHGTIIGDTYNIPGDRFYTLKSMTANDELGRKYRIDYKMRQPTPVDMLYKVSIMTNRYTSINEFNEIVQRLFNSRQQYICPNGHYISMILDNVSDESEYSINDRQFFSQTATLKVRGYMIREEDLIVEENPIATVICFDGDNAKRRKPTIELSEYDPCYEEELNFFKKVIEIDVDFYFCYPYKGKTKFTMDDNFIITGFKFHEPNNLVMDNIKLYINDELITSNLYSDSFNGYKKCDILPEDSNDENTTDIYDEVPKKKDKIYKYIKIKDEYYKWNEIAFKNGDVIVIETKKINKHNNVGGFTIIGYNKFDEI